MCSCAQLPTDVDYRVMLTFLQFYESVLKFVNFKLYHDIGLHYPPKVGEYWGQESSGVQSRAPSVLVACWVTDVM